MEKMKLKPSMVLKVAEDIAQEVRFAYFDMKGIKGVRGAIKAAPAVVARVQTIGDKLKLLGTDKKAIAVNAILGLIPDTWVPDWLIRPFISWAIEKAVKALKKRLFKK